MEQAKCKFYEVTKDARMIAYQISLGKPKDDFIDVPTVEHPNQQYEVKTIEDLFKPLKNKRQANNSHHGVVICGHRGGAKGIHLDNTIGAFRHATNIGLEMIELDVWMTADDKIIVSHGGDDGEMHLDLDEMVNHHDTSGG